LTEERAPLGRRGGRELSVHLHARSTLALVLGDAWRLSLKPTSVDPWPDTSSLSVLSEVQNSHVRLFLDEDITFLPVLH
jgi:hypothetical protein